ncbi:MAG: cell division/cell wall cluster transcriptional repressor MraZ [Alphaproteobacteria bacterium]|nr:cell division/cell wall cluster transcriptional repressor MraZ [Alphaproteobacteria bacterium]MBU0861159.1 cell division/cell wall cluster transcriptional repressor MraZ [Alphaproteobacteria bacterium]MBU1838098.1 cell division/cell wall cluster transcriptional repressor MraZ [Alphaproteobacteria bacterium]UTH45380.1 cell division/cell wall cluster transcriptional repressor MraZ [Loktanella salsilacus]UTH49144.1 cell division/cell wall cluster transcriptional repressor MraZ [Loktanella salsi
MNLSFTSTYQSKVDAKGRMSIPAKFRRVIEAGDPAWTPDQPMTAKILYGKHLGESLQVLTVEAYDAKIGRIMAMPDSDPNKNKLRKLYMGYSEDLTIDKDGRVVLALRLREKLGVVEGELSFMGLGEYFQIWKLESFEADVDEPLDEWLDEMGEDFDPMSLVP